MAPKIIDRADCDAELPELTLEGHVVSPLLHMKMQSQLTRQLASRFSAPKNIIAPAEVREYKVIIEQWVERFPPEYAFDNPDKSKDESCPWLFAHRFYVYTMACLLILNPIRHYMVKKYTWDSPQEELEVREVGIWYSLKLMKTMRLWVDKVYNRDGRLHFIIFSIFDTAAMLCTALLKDAERTIGNRQEILLAVGDAVDMLKRLNMISKTSKTSYDILERLVRRLPELVPRNDSGRQVKRPKVKSSASPPSPATDTEPTTTTTQQFITVDSALQQPVTAQPPMYPEARTFTDAVAPQEPQDFPLTQGSQQVQPHSAASTSPDALPLVPNHPAPSGHVMSTQYVYDGHEYVQQQQQPPPLHLQHNVPQNATYMAVASSSASTAPNLGDYAAPPNHGYYVQQQQPPPPVWSAGLEIPPPQAMGASGLVSSFPTADEATGLDEAAYQQVVVADPGPDFNIENLSDAQLGELAPLWSWHSGNLDFANMPPPHMHPHGYSQPM
ncbi:hypothetical protein E4U42_002595 [Claviceps africana]|uniref:Uncharacterized protein n=1 Tax=Claviceps africana TaxID=83212 RepID=A0A8K0JAF7_9HYPO|nr:hypothetical protein E4U42_002595 [Claviceps africana]